MKTTLLEEIQKHIQEGEYQYKRCTWVVENEYDFPPVPED